MAPVGPVGSGPGGAEPRGLREERPAVLPVAAPRAQGRGTARVVRPGAAGPAGAARDHGPANQGQGSVIRYHIIDIILI